MWLKSGFKEAACSNRPPRHPAPVREHGQVFLPPCLVWRSARERRAQTAPSSTRCRTSEENKSAALQTAHAVPGPGGARSVAFDAQQSGFHLGSAASGAWEAGGAASAHWRLRGGERERSVNRNDPTAPVGCQHKLAAGERQFLGSALQPSCNPAAYSHLPACTTSYQPPPPTHTHLKRPVNADGSVPEGNRV